MKHHRPLIYPENRQLKLKKRVDGHMTGCNRRVRKVLEALDAYFIERRH
jgi:hypothetical protein